MTKTPQLSLEEVLSSLKRARKLSLDNHGLEASKMTAFQWMHTQECLDAITYLMLFHIQQLLEPPTQVLK